MALLPMLVDASKKLYYAKAASYFISSAFGSLPLQPFIFLRFCSNQSSSIFQAFGQVASGFFSYARCAGFQFALWLVCLALSFRSPFVSSTPILVLLSFSLPLLGKVSERRLGLGCFSPSLLEKVGVRL